MNLKSNPTPRARRLLMGVIPLVLLGGLGCSLSGIFGATPTEAPTEALPTLPPAPVDTLPPTLTAIPPAPAGESVSFRGVSFAYDPSLAGFVNVEQVEAVEPDDNPVWLVAPEHLVFDFVDYVLQDAFHQPAIYIYPVAEFQALNEGAAETIERSRALQAQRPADPEEPLPFLPIFNAGQFFAARVHYLDFQNGAGVRFLTQYGQAVSPVNSQDLFYTFQGLTADGRYYVAAVLPVSHPSLPATADDSAALDEPAAFAEGFREYITAIEADLEAQDPGSFFPGLVLLDELVRSISVQGW